MNACRVAGWDTTARVVKPPAEPPRTAVRAPSVRPCEARAVAAEAQSAISATPHAPLRRSLCHVIVSVDDLDEKTVDRSIHILPSIATRATVIDVHPAEGVRLEDLDENEAKVYQVQPRLVKYCLVQSSPWTAIPVGPP